MDSYEKNDRSYRGASRPPRQGAQEEKPLLADMTYASGRRTPNSGRPDYYAQSAARRSRTDAAPARSARPAQNGSSTPRPGSDRRQAPVYTEMSWDELFRGSQPAPQPQQPPQPAQPQPQPQPQTYRAPQPQSRSGSPYFGGFEQERGELFADGGSGAPEAPAQRESMYIPLTEKQRPPQAPQSAYTPTRYQQTAPRQAAPRQVTPLQSIRETAYRQAARSGPRQAPPRAGTPAPAKRAAAAPAGGGQQPGDGAPPAGSHYSASTRNRGRIPPAVLGAGALLLALAVFLLAKIISGDSDSAGSTVTVKPVQSVSVSVTPVPETTPEAGAAGEATPSPTPSPSPSPTPSGPKAKKLGELIVPADWGAIVPERQKTVYDSFFDRSVMIGNSMVEGFFMWAGMEKNMEFVYNTGATVTNAVGGMDLAKLTLNKSDYYTDIYLMFGLNEIGTDVNSFVQNYKRLVDFVREHQTKANIYIVSVTPVTRKVDEDPNEVQKMDRIRTFNYALKEFCVDQNCWYLDIYSILLDKNGYLSGDYAYIGDGKHFEKSGYVAWANYMKTHYVDEGLLTE